jgi:hypothetical protein
MLQIVVQRTEAVEADRQHVVVLLSLEQEDQE